MILKVQRWILGISIYPVSYSVGIILKLIKHQNNIFDPIGSLLMWSVVLPLDSLLNCFGTGIDHVGNIFWFIVFLFFTVVNAIAFVWICSILPQKWQPIIFIMLYIVLVVINSYDLNLSF